MFVNAYEFVVENSKGESVPVSLRLGAGGQLKLKKRWNEGTTETLFGAMDDIERFIDVCTIALTYTGNKNTIKNGEDLIDLMAANGMLGMAEKQKVITSIAYASGIFSEKEKKSIDSRAEKALDGVFDDEDEKEAKNA
jgi:hypothetical protein